MVLSLVHEIRDLSLAEDEELVALVASGDASAEEELFRRYFKLVKLRSREYYLPGGDQEDLFQEGLIGFMKALRDYRAGRGAFRAFAELCVRRQIITALKTCTRQKHEALNKAASLDAPIYKDPESCSLSEILPSASNVEDCVVSPCWTEKRILENASKFLSPYEFTVLKFYLSGYDYKEIAEQLGKTLKSVDSAVFKVKLKLRRQLSEVVL